jgi:large subunit ribosomal protein L21
MYAIIRAGGKQAKVQSGDVIDIERVKGDSEELTFAPLLVVDDKGNAVSDRDLLAKASVTAKILGESQGPKIDIFKYKNKTGYRRRQGHRQKYMRIEITGIELPGSTKAKSTAKKSEASPAAKSSTEKAPAAKAPAAKAPAAKAPAAKAPAAKTAKPAKADSSEEE